MHRDGSHGMEGEWLFPLVLDRDIAQDRGERFGFMMRLVERAAAGQGRERPRNFFSGHFPETKAAQQRPILFPRCS
jgi:hypothetical protein